MEKNQKYNSLTGPALPKPFAHYDAKNELQQIDSTNVAMNKVIGTLYADYDKSPQDYERDVDE